jgi:hypothetical protein
MLKSTGNKLLDGSALEGLSRWRFKPGSLARVQIPIEFKIASILNDLTKRCSRRLAGLFPPFMMIKILRAGSSCSR